MQGKWIELRYGRPLKRGRDLFGADDFVEFLNDGADVWRAGANYSTRLITEVDLRIAGTAVSTRRVHGLHRARPRRLEPDRLDLAGAEGLRLREQGCALRRLLLHAGPRPPANSDAAPGAAPFLRPALLAVPRHDRRRRQAGHLLGRPHGLGAVSDSAARRLTSRGSGPGR